MTTRASKARTTRANQIKAAKAARSMPAAILLQKKQESDARALAIVEKLIEPKVDVQWMLENLKHINRSHMEDIAEERAIAKICGYVLCDNPLTKVVTKKYSISALRNKIYDVEVMKNYCSFTCYNAMTYILVQMLTSPLWLRSYEEIPKFKVKEKGLPKVDAIAPGVEIKITGVQLTKDDLPGEKVKGFKRASESDEESGRNESCGEDGEESDRESCEDRQDEENTERLAEVEGLSKNDGKIKESVENLANKLGKVRFRDEVEAKVSPMPKIFSEDKIHKNIDSTAVEKKERPKKEAPFSEPLKERLEKNFREMITVNTIKFLLGKKTEKQNIVRSIKNQEKYARMCERLDKLDLDLEEPETNVPTDLRPAPHFEVLKEQAKDLVIKVNAFFKGSLEVEAPAPVDQEKNDEEGETVIPLTDAHAPNALRRRLFLDKLDKVVPDLLPTLSCPGGIEYDYTVERIAAVKAIVSTFNLTAKNIVFKTAEWTIVGLLMIKMLALTDDLIEALLSTQHAASRISMISLSYGLESDYLDSLIKLLIVESDKK